MLLDRLRAHTGAPTVTLAAPGHDAHDGHEALAVTVGNLLGDAAALVQADDDLDRSAQRDLADALPSTAQVLAAVPPRHGVWLSVNLEDGLSVVPLAPGVRAPAHVTLTDQPALLRPLLEHEQQLTEVLVLTLADDAADLAVVDLRTRAVTPVGGDFPFSYPGDGSRRADRSASARRDERRRNHWRRVAEAAHEVVVARDLPVITVGVERNQAFLREVSAWPEDFAEAVIGAAPDIMAPKLVDAVIDAAGAHRDRRIREVTALLDQRADAGRVVTGMTDLYAAAVAGRIELLVLIAGAPVSGYLTESGHLTAEDPGGAAHVDDVYALGMAEVVRRGGEVVLAPEGLLDASTATLRW